MNENTLIDAIGNIDEAMIEKHVKMRVFLEGSARGKQNNRVWRKWLPLAACLALVVAVAFPLAKLVFGGANARAPFDVSYESIEELNVVLGNGLLYNKLDFENSTTNSIRLGYAGEENGVPVGDPTDLQIRLSSSADTVRLYIFFNRDNTYSLISGYEEQGLRKEIGGVTVEYSLIRDPALHGQAKFLYEGNLYVLDIIFKDGEDRLDDYLETLLGD